MKISIHELQESSECITHGKLIQKFICYKEVESWVDGEIVCLECQLLVIIVSSLLNQYTFICRGWYGAKA